MIKCSLASLRSPHEQDLGEERSDEVASLIEPTRTKLSPLEDDRSYSAVQNEHLSSKNKSQKFPLAVLYIIGNEFCERFSYFGLKTVLTLYLSAELLLDEDAATVVYHGWSSLCYVTPLLGAVLADSLWGRYRTILYISTVYLVGNIVLSLSATPPVIATLVNRKAASIGGLVLIALGTGGIKPCVSAFGGDQFQIPGQERNLSRFFTVFYFSINAGALLSTIITPILRENVQCFGGDCYSLAFAVPAALMAAAVVLFLIGTPKYKRTSPQGNVVVQVLYCIGVAGYRRLVRKESREHWLDHADDISPSLRHDVRRLLQVLILFLPLPLFWALFDQQGSRWTFQAAKLNGEVGGLTIKPDQMQVLNPLLILILLPVFDTLVYPSLEKFRWFRNPLNRMITGGLLAAASFVASGILETQMEKSSAQVTQGSEGQLRFINAVDCPVEVNIRSSEEDHSRCSSLDTSSFFCSSWKNTISPFEQMIVYARVPKANLTSQNLYDVTAKQDMTSQLCHPLGVNSVPRIPVAVEVNKMTTVVLVLYLNVLRLATVPNVVIRAPPPGMASARVLDSSGFLRMAEVELRSNTSQYRTASVLGRSGLSASEVLTVNSGSYKVFLPSVPDEALEHSIGQVTLEEGSVVDILLFRRSRLGPVEFKAFPSKPLSRLHIFWLVPQYVLISVGEVLFSVTGLEFSFKHAPESMKSVVQAAWLLTVSCGNLVVVLVTGTNLLPRQSWEFFLFAVLMTLDMGLFALLARRYEDAMSGYIPLHSFASDAALEQHTPSKTSPPLQYQDDGT